MKTNTRHWAGITAGILSLAGYASAVSIGSEKYVYDASGNIVEKAIDGHATKMSYDASNRVTTIASPSKGKEQISYDAAGRPVSYNDSSGQPTRTLGYGYADKVLQVDSAMGKAEFIYNAEGKLVGTSAGAKLNLYAWDGNVMAAEGTECFTNEAHITGGVPIMTGDRNVILSDFLGNTLYQEDQRIAGTAYGERLEKGRFTGKPFIKEIDGYIFSNRTYLPELGRWNTFDPLGYPDGKNNFSYFTDPNAGVDPEGTTQLYIDGVPEDTWVNSNDGKGVFGSPIFWNLPFSHSYYNSNSCVATNNNIKFNIIASGSDINGAYFTTINFNANVSCDSYGNLYMTDPGYGTDNILSSPLSAGVHLKKSGEGTDTLLASCDAIVGHQATDVSEFGLNTSGVSVKLTGAAPREQHFGLGEFMWMED